MKNAATSTGTHPAGGSATYQNLRASAVSFAGAGVLIRGPSGSGKSGLALQLISLGAKLLADDLVPVKARDGVLHAHPPERLRGMIEARGIGILQCEPSGPVPVRLVADLEHVEKNRLPPERSCTILGVRLPLLLKVEEAYFPAAILQFLKGGRVSL